MAEPVFDDCIRSGAGETGFVARGASQSLTVISRSSVTSSDPVCTGLESTRYRHPIGPAHAESRRGAVRAGELDAISALNFPTQVIRMPLEDNP
jgi:hypothetical protein